jgi:hypothetical protein
MTTARAPMDDRGTPVYWEAMSAQPFDSYVRTLFHPEREDLTAVYYVAPVVQMPALAGFARPEDADSLARRRPGLAWSAVSDLARAADAVDVRVTLDGVSLETAGLFVSPEGPVKIHAHKSPVTVLDPACWTITAVDWPTHSPGHQRTDLQYSLAGALMADHGTLIPYAHLDTGSLTVAAIAEHAASARAEHDDVADIERRTRGSQEDR